MRRAYRPRLQSLLTRGVDEDVARELSFHLEMREQSLRAAGADAGEARHRARQEFGDLHTIANACREIAAETDRNRKREDLMDGLRQDVRQAWQVARRRPVLSAAVVLVTALAVSAVSGVASLVWATLLQPLPLPEADRVVAIHTQDRRFPDVSRHSSAPADIIDWREQLSSFESIAAVNTGELNIIAGDEPERIMAVYVSEDIDRVIGLRALHGRMLGKEDYQAGSGPVIMLTHEYWQRAFHGNPAIVGQTVRFVAGSAQVIGVLPRMPLLARDRAGDIWVPFDLRANPARGGTWLRVVGRLKPGVTIESAQRDLNGISERLARDFPQTNSPRSAWIEPLRDSLTWQSRPLLLLLAGALALLLLTACANIAGLLLASALDRRGEFALRSALGAGPKRLGRQVLTESTLLAVLGGLLGALLAPLLVNVFLSLYPGGLPRGDEVTLRATVLALGTFLTIVMAALGAFPLLRQSRRLDLARILLSTERGSTMGGAARLRAGLVVLQIAFCTMLLMAGLVLVQTYIRVVHTPAGFQSSGLLAFHITPPPPRYPSVEQYLAFHDDLLERIRALPGVQAVAYSSLLPFDKDNFSEAMFAEGAPQTPDNTAFILYQKVSPEYPRTLGLPLLSGRELNAADREDTPRVTVINQAAADRLFPGQNPIGKRLVGRNMTVVLEVVGVVGNKRHRDLSAPPELELFVPRRQETMGRSHWIVVRTDREPASYLPTLRRIVKEMEPGMAFAHPTTLSARIHESVATERFRGFIFSGLSGMAALVAIIGVWSLLVFTVLGRTREIGIRMTLGLEARAAQREVVLSSVGYALAGVALGELSAWLLSRSLVLVIFDVPRLEPMAFLLVALVVITLAALAATGPARRVSRIDPMIALR